MTGDVIGVGVPGGGETAGDDDGKKVAAGDADVVLEEVGERGSGSGGVEGEGGPEGKGIEGEDVVELTGDVGVFDTEGEAFDVDDAV